MTKNLDDVLKEFEEKANDAISSNRKLWKDTDEDDMYFGSIAIKPSFGGLVRLG